MCSSDLDNYCFCPSPPGDLEKGCAEGIIRLFPCQDGKIMTTTSKMYKMGARNFNVQVLQLSRPVQIF